MTVQMLASITDRSVTLRMIDSGDGTPETGVTSATGGVAAWYRRGVAGAKTAISLGDHTNLTDAHSDGKLKHIGDGWYRLDLPDAAIASGVETVFVGWGATGMIGSGETIQLIGNDPAELLLTFNAFDAAVGTPANTVSDDIAEVLAAVVVVETKVDGVQTDTNDLQARLPAALVGGRMDSSLAAAGLEADAVAEIQSGLATSAAVAGVQADTDALQTAAAVLEAKVDSVQTDTNDIQTRMPAALVGGRMDASAGAMADNVLTAAAVAAGALDEDAVTTGLGNRLADHTLRRSWASAAASAYGDAKSFRSLLGAVAKLVNRFKFLLGVATIYEADDTTVLGTQNGTTDPAAELLVELDTV